MKDYDEVDAAEEPYYWRTPDGYVSEQSAISGSTQIVLDREGLLEDLELFSEQVEGSFTLDHHVPTWSANSMSLDYEVNTAARLAENMISAMVFKRLSFVVKPTVYSVVLKKKK